MNEKFFTEVLDGDQFDPSQICRRIRRLEGWSTDQLAEKLGVSRSTVNRLERAAHQPRPELRNRLFQLFCRVVLTDYDGFNLLDQLDFEFDATDLWVLNHHFEAKIENDRPAAKRLMAIGYFFAMLRSGLQPTEEGHHG
ncbi:MAG: helix-turn-helix transcriptional regulator [Candidatus Poribacteria bacterium]|jgi:transcriptional regulator with XRE-family HTH domain|nr:helix-turn-helix transcriptional regulator [Candidatus Poribacteria bacterium]